VEAWIGRAWRGLKRSAASSWAGCGKNSGTTVISLSRFDKFRSRRRASRASIACWAFQRCTTGCVNKHCCNGWNRSLSRYSMRLTTDTGEGGQPRMLSRRCGERSKADGSGL
jgi:hypothetical protein